VEGQAATALKESFSSLAMCDQTFADPQALQPRLDQRQQFLNA
jgi:hypothetical protein